MTDRGDDAQGITKRKVLLVEDEAVLRAALQRAIEDMGYAVATASDGKVAKQIFMVEPIGMVVSDIRMPYVNGIELLHWVKKLKPVPFVLMTGFSELCEAQEAQELGADGFLPKPFEKRELQDLIVRSLGSQSPSAEVNVSDQFCKLNIDDFVSGRSIQFDIYLRISDAKYVKIAHRGEDLPLDRIRAYKRKNLRFLYIRKEDFAKYVGLNVALTRAARDNSTIAQEKRLNLLKHTGEVILQRVRFEGVTDEDYEYAKTFIENAVAILGEDDDALKLLGILSEHTDFLYAHSVGVSMLSVLIAREMGWSSIVNHFKIAMGGLLHDVGQKEIDASILSKPRPELVPADVELIERHAWRGFEILGQLRAVPGDVVQIAAQHHENCLGQGFPKRLRKGQIHPLARLVAVANEICNLVLKAPNSPEIPPKEAVQRLLNFSWDKLDAEFLVAAARLFKVTPNEQLLRKHPGGMGKVSWKGKGASTK